MTKRQYIAALAQPLDDRSGSTDARLRTSVRVAARLAFLRVEVAPPCAHDGGKRQRKE
jgi:hypothetical protein